MHKIPKAVLVAMAQEINEDDLSGHEGFMCLTDSLQGHLEWRHPKEFKAVLRRHGISADGSLRDDLFEPNNPGTWDRNEARVWWLLLVAESGVQ